MPTKITLDVTNIQDSDTVPSFNEPIYYIGVKQGNRRVWLEESRHREYFQLVSKAEAARALARRYACEADDLNSTVIARMAMEANLNASIYQDQAHRLTLPETYS